MSRTGWCLTQDCDTEEDRGGCPVVAGDNPPCPCTCHGGSLEPRPFLPIVARFAEPEEDELVQDDAETPQR